MNLIENEWIPVRRRSGGVARIAPWQLTDGFAEDPFVQIAAPRPDFNGALVQFLIGLLQTCFAPEDAREWRQRLRHAPTSGELKTAFVPVAARFDLDGNGSRFLQDLTLAEEIAALEPAAREERTKHIDNIFIEVPTGKTLEDNTDLFVKRGQIAALCQACAAAALLTLQTNAPSGGQGHRTSIRGGGPLTTLVLAGSLWATIWSNVLDSRSFFNVTGNPARNAPADQFPWLGASRTSEGGRGTTPEDAHPTQVFWAMPRRIRLMFCEGQAKCDLCGGADIRFVRQYQTKNLGVHYTGPWRHPLSPYFVAQDGTPSAVHPQPGGIGYRHWLGLVQGIADGRTKREPAAVVERYVVEQYLLTGSDDLRLWAFGYEMDNMKARCWHESIMPLVLCPEEIREGFAFHVTGIVKSAELAATETRRQLTKALFKRGGDVKGDLSFIAARYWQVTERGFYALLPQVREALRDRADVTAILEEWHKALVDTAQRIFDDVSQTGAFDAADPKRIALAWRDLQNAIRGRKMRQTLGLPDKHSKKARVGKRTEGR
jgi:CRISPR system Cascade subunit CasA